MQKKDDDGPPAAGGGGTGKPEEPENKGKIMMDATCVSTDIRYPTDLGLLNEAWEITEKYIDVLYEPLKGKIAKPRTYRNTAMGEYLTVIKMRKPRKNLLR